MVARCKIKDKRAFRNGTKGILETRFNVAVIKWKYMIMRT